MVPLLTQITKINRDGGPGYRLTAVQDSAFIGQDDLDKFKMLRIAVATKFGLVSSPYSLEPKAFSIQGHNIVKGVHPDFKSLVDFVSYHTFSQRKVVQLFNTNSLKKKFQIEVKVIQTKLWKDSGVLILIPVDQESPDLTPLNCTRTYITPSLKASLEHRFSADKVVFRHSVKQAAELFRDLVANNKERDIYMLYSTLQYFGIKIQHRRTGIDSPTAEITFFGSKRSRKILFPVELKTHSKKFYSDARTPRGQQKYWGHFPLTVLCLRHNSQEWKRDAGVGILSLEELLRVVADISSVRIRLPAAA